MKPSTQQEYERRVLRAQQLVEAHLDETLSPTEVARSAGMSLHHFHRVFRGMTGETVMGFTRRLRLERAARSLRDSERDVLPIALDAGYQSHEAFTRAFSEAFGVPPSTYRSLQAAPEHRRTCTVTTCPDDVVIRDEPPRDVLVLRHLGPYDTVSLVWDRLVAWYLEAGLGGEEALCMFALVPDDPQVTAADKLRYDACLLAPAELPTLLPPGPVTRGRVPGGRYAVLRHRGPYDTLADSYLALIGAWFPQRGHVPAPEPVVEHYLNSPANTAPADLLTEIWVRIEERGFDLAPTRSGSPTPRAPRRNSAKP